MHIILAILTTIAYLFGSFAALILFAALIWLIGYTVGVVIAGLTALVTTRGFPR